MTTIMSDVDVAVAEEGLLKTTEEGVFFLRGFFKRPQQQEQQQNSLGFRSWELRRVCSLFSKSLSTFERFVPGSRIL